ncbi:MAG: hypothetical protein RL129_1369 [Actinomycetota bacterium]|jgi:Zn-dependent protease with chaperone function
MRVLTSAVLTMEFMVIGFAMLLVDDKQSALAIWLGWLIAILLLVAAGLMKKRVGFILGSTLQVALIGYGFYVPAMFFMGALFAGLWIAAVVVGRKGEAIRAELLRQKGENK